MSDDPSTTPSEEERYSQLQLQALEYARNGETEPLLPMIEAGLPVNLADENGQTLLMLACYHGHEETARELLARGAEADRRNDHGQTPLGGVAFKGFLPIARLLVEHGADPKADNGSGMTPVQFADMFGQKEMGEYLRSVS
jgi:hypothetical protein